MDRITKREKDVLKLLAEGKNSSQIANELYISDGTVKQHLANIYRKLGVRNKVQAVLIYLGNSNHIKSI